jgi:hypothetical protein
VTNQERIIINNKDRDGPPRILNILLFLMRMGQRGLLNKAKGEEEFAPSDRTAKDKYILCG